LTWQRLCSQARNDKKRSGALGSTPDLFSERSEKNEGIIFFEFLYAQAPVKVPKISSYPKKLVDATRHRESSDFEGGYPPKNLFVPLPLKEEDGCFPFSCGETDEG
jgi:hypothetical protein